MICYVRRSTVDYDIRLQKYIRACQETQTPYIAITWDRLKDCRQVFPYEIQYRHEAPYGGGFKNLFGLLGWVFFVYWQLIVNFRKFKTIHAVNLDSVVITFPFKLLGKKIIYDIYDSERYKRIERWFCMKSDLLILPSKARLSQSCVVQSELKRFLEVENVPQIDEQLSCVPYKLSFGKTNIRLAYVGVFQRHIRGLENLLAFVASNPNFELDIAGVGGGFEAEVQNASNACNRIRYHGKVDYHTALVIMGQAHFIMALYYRCQPEHVYASPNKYYESLFLQVPIVTSRHTLVGDKVEQYNTGYAITDTEEALRELFANSDSKDFFEAYMEKRENCANHWREYASYFETKLCGEYIDEVNYISTL